MDGLNNGNSIKPDKYLQCLFDDVKKEDASTCMVNGAS